MIDAMPDWKLDNEINLVFSRHSLKDVARFKGTDDVSTFIRNTTEDVRGILKTGASQSDGIALGAYHCDGIALESLLLIKSIYFDG
ncbi:hypothetical protein OUZ56_016357 [Daphnia magna]|uniref:Uncharacterized protein n=1 Tax=Daphnia magna TaxID=35525 RepID=A0ABR0AQE8_9CRUS|nr:hypothetical protein OUZ56_016357 [Daphnia magna]